MLCIKRLSFIQQLWES